jgi:hypothetical protein
LQRLDGELTASFPSLKNVKVNPIYVCQAVSVCLNCGIAELRVPDAELEVLRKTKNEGPAS